MTAYQDLEARFHRLYALRGAAAVLQWDSSTMMPKGGAKARAEQLAQLNLVCHEALIDPALADLLNRAEAHPHALDSWQGANLREMRRQWRHANAVPPRLVEDLTRSATACEHYWREARARNDFAGLAPLLESLLALVREAALAKAGAFGLSPYDALLDEYEPGLSAARIDHLFDELATFLASALPEAVEKAAAPSALPGPFPAETQRRIGLRFMADLGFDFDRGRLDISHHPFTGGVPDDVRLTTRYDETDFTKGLMGVLHETGHGLYESGLPEQWRHQPVGQAVGMVLHESQSLLVEMQVCRGDAFLTWAAPQLAEAFGGLGAGWKPESLARLYRRVRPGLIRVDADEVTYPAHIILRYRLERALIDGRMGVRDLPEAWRAGMKDLLGIAPPDDRDGCMQDIHWPSGAFGYFPTYTLGALAAAQLFAAARRQDKTIEAGIAKGDFAPLLAWLRKNVHALGSLKHTDEVLTAATGAPLGIEAWRRHIEARYLV
ncbi:MAG: carboxypeptidase M32 [Alphaproteobacteria bacterium]|nr:carboxypeptidase M32 [Alphaproteobacteria bacterium]